MHSKHFNPSLNPNLSPIMIICVLFCSVALYIISCAPGTVWQDSGVIQYRTWHNDIEGDHGLAVAHPLYYLFAITAKHIPIGEYPFQVNLLTALISSLAVTFLYIFLQLWFKTHWASLLGATLFAFSHTFWNHASVPETYNLTIALIILELIMFIQFAKTDQPKWLKWAWFINGLGIGNHMLAVFTLLALIFITTIAIRKKQISIHECFLYALLWIVGASPYLYLIIKDLLLHQQPWQTLSSALFGHSWKQNVLNTEINLRIIKENIMWIGLNFPNPAIIFIIPGLYAVFAIAPAKKKWFSWIIIYLTFAYLLFAFRYTIVDRYAFFIPFYCLTAILVAAGLVKMFKTFSFLKMVLFFILIIFLNLSIYYWAPKIAEKIGITSGKSRIIPYRNDLEYFLRPWMTGYRGTERFATEIFDSAKKNAVIYADPTTAPPLLLFQEVKNQRPDIHIISKIGSSDLAPVFDKNTIDKLLLDRPIYTVSLDSYGPEFLNHDYYYKKEGLIYRIYNKNQN